MFRGVIDANVMLHGHVCQEPINESASCTRNALKTPIENLVWVGQQYDIFNIFMKHPAIPNAMKGDMSYLM